MKPAQRMRIATLIAGCALLPAISQARADELKRIEIGTTPSDQAEVAAAVLDKAYRRLGLQMQLHQVPMRRSQQMTDSGALDGDLIRIAAVSKELSNVILVKVPLYQFSLHAYRMGSDCPALIHMSELAEYNVLVVRGMRAAETSLPGHAHVPVAGFEESVRQLQRGKADYALGPPLSYEASFRRAGIKDYCAIPTDTPPFELFHVLNRRHAELAGRLEQVLGEMLKSGEMATIRQEAERRLRAR